MEIHAGGKVWEVETRASRPLEAGTSAFCGVTFRDCSDVEGEVAIGWVPNPEPMTERMARRLFELAGERLWRDPRTGVVHRVILGDGPAGAAPASLQVRFVTAGAAHATRYDLDVPVGMAADDALQHLLDRALRRGPARDLKAD